jgi:phospholipase A1/A2
MAGLEKGNEFRLQGRLWRRINEAPLDDDNPDILNLIGRAEVSGYWNVNKDNTLGMTLRHSLRATANGSVRVEWLRSVSEGVAPSGKNGLRLHTQLFTGYGDSLVDYNRRRTVLNVGLSLVDW